MLRHDSVKLIHENGMKWNMLVNKPCFYSLIEDVCPVCSHEIPGQGLAHHITGNVDNSGGSVLLTNQRGIQSVLQVPFTETPRIKMCENVITQCALALSELTYVNSVA